MDGIGGPASNLAEGDEVVIVGRDAGLTGPDGYLRWLELNGVARNDQRLSSLAIRLTSQADPTNPRLRQRVYVLPKLVHEELVGGCSDSSVDRDH